MNKIRAFAAQIRRSLGWRLLGVPLKHRMLAEVNLAQAIATGAQIDLWDEEAQLLVARLHASLLREAKRQGIDPGELRSHAFYSFQRERALDQHLARLAKEAMLHLEQRAPAQDLPPLPAQEWVGYDPERGDMHGYTADQMRSYGIKCAVEAELRGYDQASKAQPKGTEAA